MEIEIASRKIGDGYPVFFIAEAGVNHNGSTKLGLQLIDRAAEAGADAVKFLILLESETNFPAYQYQQNLHGPERPA